MNGTKPEAARFERLFANLALFNRAFRKYRTKIFVLTILGFLSGLFEAVGINAIIPLFSLLVRGQGQATDFVSRTIEGLFRSLEINFSIVPLLIFILTLFLLKTLIMILFNYINQKIDASYEETTRNELMKAMFSANWPYLLRQKTGYLETVMVSDINASTHLLRYLSSVILALSSLLMYILVALNISTTITLITVAIGAVLLLIFKPLLTKTRHLAQNQANMNKQVANLISEHMIGMKTVKTMGTETEIRKMAGNFFKMLRNFRVKIGVYQNTVNLVTQPLGILLIVVVFAFSYNTPGFNIASFAAILYLIEKMFALIQNLQSRLHHINEFIPHLKISMNFKEEAQKNKEQDAGLKNFSFQDSLEYRDVAFAYPGKKPILSQVNFRIERGSFVGLIGPSGAGKTTIVDLLLRLFEPQQGTILIDGENIANIKLQEWRKNIGYVSQDIFLLNDTIRNNIRFYDEGLTEEELARAAELANIYEFVQSLPEGFQTIVGERGVMLSVGQRQRVILARILARKPQILVLDEATSALDNESEVQIQKAIANLKGKVTVLAIAHRLTTIINSDKLLVLDQGKIAEEGSPRQLLENRDSYFFKVHNLKKAEHHNA